MSGVDLFESPRKPVVPLATGPRLSGWRPLAGVLGLLAFIVLGICIAASPRTDVYDEMYFRPNVGLMQEKGLGPDFLTQMRHQVPGPLYQVVHIAALPVTGGDYPSMRWVNYWLLPLTLLPVFLVLRRRVALPYPVLLLAALSIPTVWRMAGLALSELPTACVAAYGLLTFHFALEKRGRTQTALCALGGLLIGVSTAGRLPFAGLIVILPLLGLGRHGLPWPKLLLAALLALPVPIALVSIWGSYTPPNVRTVGGISFQHLFMAYGYAGIIALLVNPRFLVWNRIFAQAAVPVFVVALLVNGFLLHVVRVPMGDSLGAVLPTPLLKLVGLSTYPVLFTLALWVGCSFLLRFLEALSKDDQLCAYAIAAAGGLIASTLFVSLVFSSRYVGQALPFLLLAYLMDLPRPQRWIIPAGLLGATLGLIGLLSMYNTDYSAWKDELQQENLARPVGPALELEG